MARNPLWPVARRWWSSNGPRRSDLRRDTTAGLTGAVGSVPDGMSASVLAGVSPVYGLYASFAGRIAGGLSVSTRMMVVTTTSAAALAAGSALESVSEADRPATLFLLTMVAGGVMVAAGVLRLGRYTRFVSHSVMTGFLAGIAVNIAAGQLPALTGADAVGDVSLAQAVDLATNPTKIAPASLLTGLGALLLLVMAGRTPRLASIGSLVALVIPTVVVLVAGVEVTQVRDQGDIPQGLPLPAWPHLGLLSSEVVAGALSVAAIILVQGAGVRETAPNPGRRPSDPNRDFVAQGVGSLAAGLFQGLPVGGSVSQTGLNVTAGARSRWASVFSGLWLLAILVAFSGLVARVAMPTLAAILIFVAVRSLRPREVVTILRTGPIAQVALVTTFLATLFLPVPAAVGVGVALSLLLQLNQEALDLSVVRLVHEADGRWVEHPAPDRLPDHDVVVLDVYGSLFYAGSRTLQARLPEVADAEEPVVVLRLRGRTSLGATFFHVIADYAGQLADAGGRLYLSGLEPDLARQVHDAGRVVVEGPVQAYGASTVLGESTASAEEAAHTWLIRDHQPDQPDDSS